MQSERHAQRKLKQRRSRLKHHMHEEIKAAERIVALARDSAGEPGQFQKDAFLVARAVLVAEGIEPEHWPDPVNA